MDVWTRLIFFNQNLTWAQPGFYVHQMIAETWQPIGVAVTVTCGDRQDDVNVAAEQEQDLSVSAQRSDPATDNGATSLVLRVVNEADAPAAVALGGAIGSNKAVAVLNATVLALPVGMNLTAVNTPREPDRLRPAALVVPPAGGKFTLPPHSFAVIELSVRGSK